MGALSNVITRIKALITADNKQFKKTMKDTTQETKKTTKGVNSGFKGMSTLIKGVAGGIAVAIGTKIIKSLSNIAKEMGLMQLKANAVFGAYRKDVDMMAKDTANAMGLTETQFVNAASGIQDLLIPIGFARKEATKMTLETMKLAGALSTWTGGMYSAEEVGGIFSKAVLGEREQLKSLGIAISEAEVQARLLAKGQKGLTGQALAQAKAQATLELITEKSTDAQAAFADGQGNIVIKSAQVKANLKGMAEDITKILAPALQQGTGLLASMTGELRQLLDDAALISQSDVLTTWEKWQYRLAGLTGGAAGMIRQMEILGMAMSSTEFDAVVDELLKVDGTMEQVESALQQYGEMAVEHGKKYYEEQKKLREKDAQETKAQEEQTHTERLKAQKAFYWALEGQLMAHQETVKETLDEGYKGMNVAIDKANEGLQQIDHNSDALMGQLAATLPVIQATETAWQQARDAIAQHNWEMENTTAIGQMMGEMMTNVSDSMIQASSMAGASFGDIARAAAGAAKKSIAAYIAEGIAAQVKSAMEFVPFPFGIIAAGLAGGAAAALFNTIIPSFAEGGMVTQPTLALVGDNPSGKEMIIPWEKLGEMGGGPVEIYGELRGDTMYLQRKRTEDKLRRTGRL